MRYAKYIMYVLFDKKADFYAKAHLWSIIVSAVALFVSLYAYYKH